MTKIGEVIVQVKFMELALGLAQRARDLGEVPIGALVVRNGIVIGEGYNQRETKKDPTAHAEILAIQSAAQFLVGWRLTDCELYVTLEPCCMCAGAIVNSRISQLIFGAYDPKAGAVSSLMNLVQDKRLNHQVEVYGGILEEECGRVLKEFFRSLRKG